MMKWYSTYEHPKGLRFIIEEDVKVGFYFYVYGHQDSFEEDMSNTGYCSHSHQDHLQDTLEMAQRYAIRHFGVPLESWVKIK